MVNIPVASTKSETSGNDLRRIGDVNGELDGASTKMIDNSGSIQGWTNAT